MGASDRQIILQVGVARNLIQWYRQWYAGLAFLTLYVNIVGPFWIFTYKLLSYLDQRIAIRGWRATPVIL